MKGKVSVTKTDIETGRKLTIGACPVSRALSREIGEACLVDYDTIQIKGKNYRPPKEIRSFIHSFDVGDAVKPFEIDLSELEPTSRKIQTKLGLRGDIAFMYKRAQSYTNIIWACFSIALIGAGVVIGAALG